MPSSARAGLFPFDKPLATEGFVRDGLSRKANLSDLDDMATQSWVLSQPAFSGSFYDLADRPELGTAAALSIGDFATAEHGQMAEAALPRAGGVMTGALHLAEHPVHDMQAATKKYVDDSLPPRKSAAITGASSGQSVQVELGGYIFRAIKQSSSNYWGIRIVNDTGASVRLGVKSQHFYGGAGEQVTGKTNAGNDVANGAEFNPDTESGDIGYGTTDIFITNMFDATNMRAFRITLFVYTGSAVIVAERLH